MYIYLFSYDNITSIDYIDRVFSFRMVILDKDLPNDNILYDLIDNDNNKYICIRLQCIIILFSS